MGVVGPHSPVTGVERVAPLMVVAAADPIGRVGNLRGIALNVLS
jgi:hypothetical protein